LGSVTIPRQRFAAPGFTWQAVEFAERISSVVLMAAACPLVAGSAAMLALCSRRTPLIAHRRVGHRGETLWMLKLRTMWSDDAEPRRDSRWVEYIEDEAGPRQKSAADPRVSNAFARFCRRHSIDELPQLWHVLRGEMALVGPRPATASEVRELYAGYSDEILQAKPGIAGLWQVSGRNRLTMRQRRDLDLQFVRSRSLKMYARILWRTIPEVFRGANSW
jgi:exopolysaccharide production protein ExoY